MSGGAEQRHPASHQLAWHRAECWGYTADLDLWRELAGATPRRVLDLGCGAGRVALDLARRGHLVTGIDNDPVLIEALGAEGAGIEALTADARDFDLGRRFDLILAPMQTLQLLTEPGERALCLARVRRHLTDDGLFAAAFVEIAAEAPVGDLLRDHTPAPDFDDREPGLLAASTTTGLLLEDTRRLRIRRLRQVYVGSAREAAGRHEVEFELALLSRRQIESELEAAGMRLDGWRSIAPTESHMGAVVAIARAACQSA